MTDTTQGWAPDSWRSKPIKQCPEYPDQEALKKATTQLKRLPPIVHPREIERLKELLSDVAHGKAFLLQGGDCAELFDYCEQSTIESKIKLLLQMSLVLIWGGNKRVVRIGRMAGQYAKPRSSPTEIVDGREVPSFRGDILNGFPLDQRELDPGRMVQAYHHSSATLNYVRASISSGIADLHRPLDWGLGHVRDATLKAKYEQAVDFLTESLRFMQTIGADKSPNLGTVELYTSHEGLLLEYEEPLTRLLENPSTATKGDEVTAGKKYYDTSAHFLWIGDRTRQIDGAHVEFFRGIANPIGVKVGPSTPASDLLSLLRKLNPDREAGKITLITRYGADRVAELLPAHIRAVEDSEYRGLAVWQCDPMHGNTRSVGNFKTREFKDIFEELSQTLRIHREEGSYLGGVHLELTGDAVTECLGGAAELEASDLPTNYTTFCDPRLNEKQALELAFLVADHYRKGRTPPTC
ncbi:phospho-2-dehydro-3-deoxyheptonate aldolase [Pyricularia oryzae 70-15]|uniref:Phospho-2-dehydro-3-deoxyheptonate aldolase n=3 Tax=Pyricularia oryzae TaxID=318829 RepID=G4N683_PYRO7|nr:phospho-2-dehydro-3-deoxyheptonate aldolase [Pyricularia oryzae 70-15]EHA49807.1 phospho-2-dehydro-3-deoxyheptonate aldolase [Pyricularia oryzae 70-15]ELQ40713.1 phospho-2-dehydro-3-deoxyheptonate aldolase [Pyricularia oryzae Y34]KAI7917394.1 phospho-2-dehydro-3-deoxyheptonate aldolase [Pyricularia oryzae]KAI7923809.1 phospho-2-dehydro-3-deoxyheptonate aldolase [Pyricularia oryzae]